MHLLLLTVTTNIKWIDDTARIPFIGHVFLFIMMFIPPALFALLSHVVIPGLSDDAGFGKALLVLLPGWNTLLWFSGVRLYIFVVVPAWIFFGGLAALKVILLMMGIVDV